MYRLTEVESMNVQFVTSVAPIVRDADAARSFYRDALGLSFGGHDGNYGFTHKLEETKHFGLWPLSEATNACFGNTEWPDDIPVPRPALSLRSLT
jgi:catechol 2,3-dioxygenase-like lactoylglutathione lyase family enzyme